MRRPFVREPAPFVTRWRRRTVAKRRLDYVRGPEMLHDPQLRVIPRLDAVIGDDLGHQPRRFGLARVGADDVVGVGRLDPALAGAVDAERLALDLGADSAREDIREDEAVGGMAVRRREAAGAVVHLDD